MFLFLLLAFTAIPILELSLLFEVGREIGGWMTLWVVLVTGVVGASLSKSQGRVIFHQIQQELNQGAMPARTVVEGFLIFAGGLLLLTPGFITDTLGLAMVIPGSRHLLSLFLQKWVKNRLKQGGGYVRSNMGASQAGFYHSSQWKDSVRADHEGDSIRDAEVIDVEVIPYDKR